MFLRCPAILKPILSAAAGELQAVQECTLKGDGEPWGACHSWRNKQLSLCLFRMLDILVILITHNLQN